MNARKLFRIGIVAVPLILLIIFFPAIQKIFAPAAPVAVKPPAGSTPKEIPSDSTDFKHSNDSKKLFAAFYHRLASAKKENKLVRILHYGDSQIEADRVSGTLRTKLQENFGGSGIGWFPVNEVSIARNNVLRSTDGNWKRNELKSSKTPISTGFGGLVNTFTGGKASVRLKPGSSLPALSQKPEQLRIFYSGGDASSSVSVKDGEKTIGNSALNGAGFGTTSFDLPAAGYSDLKIDFAASASPEIFGLALDGKNGVAVDNISLRGSSATEFTSMDTTRYSQQLQALQPGMIIMEFGLNVVPYITDDYQYYEKLLIKQLGMIRRAAPEAAILVVGVSDASQRKNGQYLPYPNIEKIRNAQRNAAEKTGCAFWDLRAVMGGKGSMNSWYQNKLAEKDHLHFSNSGAALAGEKLGDALLRDYTRQTGMDIPSAKNNTPKTAAVAVK